MQPDVDDPFTTSATAELLARAGHQLRDTDRLMGGLEKQVHELLRVLAQAVGLLEKLEIERNTWKFRAREMEGERNMLQGRVIDLERQYRMAARRAAELGALTGEARCPECGSLEITLTRGGYGPIEEGGARWIESRLTCQECGHREDCK